jgi:hypothetical protein
MSSRVSFSQTALAARSVIAQVLSTLSLVAIAALITVCGPSTSLAQTNPLQPGQVTQFNPASSCTAPNGSTPLTINGHLVAVCYTATVTNCPSYQNGVTIPMLNALVAVSTPTNWNNGTIFLHGGGTGEYYFDADYNGTSYATEYYNAGFQVVQIAWAGDWSNNTSTPPVTVKAMKYDACRPATILNYVYTSPLVHLLGATNGAMCAQGHSAGSAAMAFALSWYGASSYLNDVVLTSGPVYSDIEAGCQYPAAPQYVPQITVCPAGQFGCIGNSWTEYTQYLNDGTSAAVAENTYPGANCNNYENITGTQGYTTATQNQDWHTMSINSSGASYSYPKTSLYAFLCSPTSQDSPNNSAAQGQLFYQNFTSASHPLNYGVYRVDNCGGDELIWDGNTSDGPSAFAVSSNAMLNYCHK